MPNNILLKFLELCRYHNPQARIVFTSTRQVYGKPQFLPVSEEYPILHHLFQIRAE